MSEKVIPEELREIIYRPQRYDFARIHARCSHRVFRHLHWHQCSRWDPRHLINGFGFCTQHAKMVRKRLEEK